jgi:UTP--glucose-1-phosphate uridylyltransferase
MLGDDLIIGEPPVIQQLVNVFKRKKASVIAVEQVPEDRGHRYGIIKGKEVEDNLFQIEDIIEKPSREEAPSNIAAIGRYVFTPGLFRCLEDTKPGVGNEIQLTDAIKMLLSTESVYAYQFSGTRYDIGSKEDLVKATIGLALTRDDMKDSIREYVKGIL